MANDQDTGLMDKYIEKIILAICLIVLLYAVVHFGIGTPRRLPVVTGMGSQEEMVPPGEVDKTLLAAMQRVETRIKREKPKEAPVREDLSILKKRQDVPLFGVATLRRLDYGEPIAKGAEKIVPPDERGVVTLAQLAMNMPAPAKPVNWCGNEISYVQQNDAAGQAEDKVEEGPMWRAVSWYPFDKLTKLWSDELVNTLVRPKVIAWAYEVEFQQLQPDKTYKKIDSLTLFRLKDPRTGKVLEPPTVPAFDGKNADAVKRVVEEHLDNRWMQYMLQPAYLSVWDGDAVVSWQQHWGLDVAKEFPPKVEATTPTSPTAPVPGAPITPTISPRRTVGRRGGVPEGDDMMMPGSRRGRRTPAGEGGIAEAVVPKFDEQLQGKMLFWFHSRDLEYGRTYRCRFRLVFFNPILTATDAVAPENKQDVKEPFVMTKWSPWSDSVRVDRQIKFFVTSQNPIRTKRSVTVTVFTKVLDQWVSREIDKIIPGKTIGKVVSMKITNPVTGSSENMDVNFDTGTTVIELNFNKRYMRGNRLKTDGVEMVYLDALGVLRRRMLHSDRDSQEYKDLREDIKSRRIRPTRPTKTKGRKGRRGGVPDEMSEMEPGGIMW